MSEAVLRTTEELCGILLRRTYWRMDADERNGGGDGVGYHDGVLPPYCCRQGGKDF